MRSTPVARAARRVTAEEGSGVPRKVAPRSFDMKAFIQGNLF
jgi:hypothetical protein